MSEGLTTQEWTLLHKVMDRVEMQRAALPAPNAEKIRASALATYQHQGIPVSEQELDTAVRETLAQWHQDQRSREKPLPIPALPSHLLWRWSQAWSVVPADENLLGHRPAPFRGSSIQRWEQSLLPYAQHLPLSDQALSERLILATKFQLARWKNSNMACLGFALLSLTVGSGIVLLGGGFAGVAFAFVNSYLAFRSMLRGVDAQAKLALTGQALEDLEAQQWESIDLKRALQGTGMLVSGSLRPLSPTGPEWGDLRRRIKGLPDLESRWAEWGASPFLRANDRLILEKAQALMLEHPTRQLMRRIFDRAKKAVAPLLWGRP